MNVNYYESHITVEPVFGDRLELFKALAAGYRFQVADLLLQKRADDRPERSAKDSFCTGRSKTFDDIKQRMDALSTELISSGIKVWRKKIEAVIYDERLS